MRSPPLFPIALLMTVGWACDHYHLVGTYEGGAPEIGGTDGGADGSDAALDDAGAPEAAAPAPPVLPLGARHLAFDPVSKRLFATVGAGGEASQIGGGADATANSLVVIDAASARVSASVPIGAKPNALGLSDDGTTAWVGIDGAHAIRRVDLGTAPPAAGPSFQLPASSLDPTMAASIWVLQGSASAIAVSLKIDGPVSPNFAGVAIFDDGVARGQPSPAREGPATLVRGPAGWLFGFDTQSTGFNFFSLAVTAEGLTQKQFGVLITGFDTDIVYAAGRVYASNGPVVDVSVPAAPVRAGTFAFTGAIAPVPAKKRAFMLSPPAKDAPEGTKARLRVLDTERFVEVSGTDVPGLAADEAVWDLTQTGDGQLAFIAGVRPVWGGAEGRVVFLTIEPLP